VGSYFLIAKELEVGGREMHSVPLHLITKRFSIFVQTDKAVYKPGDEVQFRIIILNAETKPYRTNDIIVFITDSANNRIRQYSKFYAFKSVFMHKFLLSNEPILGTWQIHVKLSDTEVVKEFEVATYILPTFEVKILTKLDISQEEDMIISVDAKYTYGKNVDGEITITAETPHPWSWLPTLTKKYSVTLTDTKTTTISLKNDLNLQNVYWQTPITVTAIVKEKLTGNQYNDTITVTVHEVPYLIDIKGSSENIKPDLPFTVTAFVQSISKVPINDSEDSIIFFITYTFDNVETSTVSTPHNFWWQQPEFVRTHETRKLFLRNGVAELHLSIHSNMTSVSVDVSYKNAHAYFWASTLPSRSNKYIQIAIKKETAPVDKQINVRVLSNVKLSQLNYVVIGSGNVLTSKKLKIPNKKVIDFTITLTNKMTSSANLIVYYITSQGEIVSDRVNLNLNTNLQNYVSSLQTKN
jgi:CD109 antigen